MAQLPEPPSVQLSHDDIVAFWRDGVICVRQLYSAEWRDRLAGALAEAATGEGPGLGRMSKNGDYSEAYSWLWQDTIRDFVLHGPTAWIARELFGSTAVRFYYDQIFIKAPASLNATPWHHDFTFWPLQGDQILSSWTSLDPVDAESSALEFLAGSHRWPQRFKAIGADGSDLSTEAGLSDLPDIDGDRGNYSVLSWSLEPGDALIFHALTVHGARRNGSTRNSRRAITTRWCGDDVSYKAHGIPFPYRHGLKAGDPIGGPLFPQVLPKISEADIAMRERGPILPDPALLEEEMLKFMQAKQAAQEPRAQPPGAPV